MITQTISVNECSPQTIVIGRRGTYDTLQIAFDLSYLVESYGNGVAVLAVKRSQDASAYPAVVTQEDATLLWTVNETDTAYVGSGECQLMWYVDGGLAKTIIYPMVVMRDILATAEEPPEGYENWIEHLAELGAETQQNAQDAEQSASDAKDSEESAAESAQRAEDAAGILVNVSATATTLEPGQPATAEYDEGVFKFGIPKGDKLTYADLTEADKEDLVQGPIKDAQDDAVEAVGTAKTNAVDAVNQAGTTKVSEVNQAGTTQVGNVNNAGTAQVSAVNQAGAAQVQAVEDKGDEVLNSIPQDYSDLVDDVADLSRQLSDVKIYPKVFRQSDDAITIISGYNIELNGNYQPVTYSTYCLDQDSYFKVVDGAESISMSGKQLYVRFYDAELAPLGNGGQTLAESYTVNVLASNNPNLSSDAKWVKFGGNAPNLNGVVFTNLIAGKFVSASDALDSVEGRLDDAYRHLSDKQDKTNYVTLSGTIITQTGVDNTMYLCGELAELTFTAPASGQTAIRFSTGTTATVASFPGVTWLNGFDPNTLETERMYEINILNLVGVASWT